MIYFYNRIKCKLITNLQHNVEHSTELSRFFALSTLYDAHDAYNERQIYFSTERSGAPGLGSNGTLTMDDGTRTLNTSKTGSGKLVLDSSSNGSGSLGVFRQNSEGRWVLSTGENVSAKDLGKRPVDLIETTERTLASYQKMKAGRAALGKEQPWIVHNSEHIWKEKIVGMPQRTGKKETLTSILNPHAKESARIAIELAKNPEVERVFLNRGIKKASGHPIQGSNRRPDVTYITKDGKVHQVEVASKWDDEKLLRQRMELSKQQLPEHLRGRTDVISYEDYMKAIDK